MKRYYKIILTISVLLSFSTIQNAQEVSLPAAPEAEAMKEYVDVPVDLYSGIPSVNFPIYTFATRDLSVPISLSYHSNGNKVAEEASWVGLGWSLSAEGMITREIRGKDDFGGPATGDACAQNIPYLESIPYLPEEPSGGSLDEYFYSYTPLPCEALQCGFISNDGVERNDEIFCSNFLALPLDPEPDLFTYNIGGYSGKFLMNKEGNYIPVSDHALTIEQVGTNVHPQWRIRTPDGVTYYFEETIQYTHSSTRTVSYQILDGGIMGDYIPYLGDDPCVYKQITSWYLDRIESPNGDEIYFDYEVENKGIKALPNFSETQTENLRLCLIVTCPTTTPLQPDQTLVRSVTKTEYDRVCLTQISGKDEAYGKVVFNSSDSRDDLRGSRRLDQIDIYRPDIIKRFSFDYDYFTSNATDINAPGHWPSLIPNYGGIQGFIGNSINENNTTKRLRLLGFQEFNGSESIPPYQFAYYEDEKLPAKTSLATDFWGFYNGVTNNNSSLSKEYTIAVGHPGYSGCWVSEGFLLDGANREANSEKAKAWILNKITYPTGGTASMEYEGNEYKLPPGEENYSPIPVTPVELGQSLEANAPPPVTEATITIGEERPYLQANVVFEIGVNKVLDPQTQQSCTQPACEAGTILFRIDVVNPQTGISVIGTPIKVVVPDYGDYVPLNCESYPTEEIALSPGTYKIKLLDPLVIDSECTIPVNIDADISVRWDEYELINSAEGGGLRVQSTELDDGRGHKILREYVYEADGGTSGIMQNRPVNKESNIYIVVAGYCGGMNGTIALTDRIIRHSNSQVTLANSFAGSFVGYEEVLVKHGGGAFGTSKSIFYNDQPLYDEEPHGIPKGYNLKNGKLLRQEEFDDQGVLVREVINTYQSTNFEPIWGVYTKVKADHQSNLPTGERPCNTYYSIYFYATFPQWHRISQTKEIDHFENSSVTKTTSFTYNTTNYLVSSSSFVNSDLRTFRTEYKYPFDLPNHEFMLEKGIITPVLEEKLMVKGPLASDQLHQVSGTKTTFKEYGQDDLIVADQMFNWEGQAYDLVGTFTEYNSDALPTKFDKNYYPEDEIYEWFESGNKKNLLKKKTYKDFVWQFDYHSNNRQLKERTEPDGTSVQIEYDDLQRLETLEPYGNGGTKKSTTSVNYVYFGPNYNRVSSETVYTDETKEKKSTKYYDGLGRYYKTLMHQYVNEQDVITNEIIFDNNGRVQQQTYLPGSFTTFEYEASPLSRLLKEIYPDGEEKQFEYGGGDHYQNTVVDENGNPTTTLTEIVGRTHQMINADGNATTYAYDDWGNILNIETPAGSYYVYTYLYDQNHLETKYVPGGGTTTYDYYDDTDLLKSETDANNNHLEYVYDDYDRIDEVLLDGVTIIDNKWYESGHVDKIESVTNDILSELSGNTKDSYVYDEFGRTEEYSFEHLQGTDVTNYTYDMADRTRQVQLAHNASEQHDFLYYHDYDRYDRIEHSKFQLDGGAIKEVATYGYNNRAELITKRLGDNLQRLDYGYHIRGWLQSINQKLVPGQSLLTCDPIITVDEPGEPPVPDYPDSMLIGELISRRFGLTIESDNSCTPVICPPVNCDSAQLIAQQIAIDSIHEQLIKDYTEINLIPCADGTVDTTYTPVVTRFNYPTHLHRVRLCNQFEMYVLEDYLEDVPGNYEIMQTVQIDSSDQFIQVEQGDHYTFLPLEQVIVIIIQREDFTLNGYEVVCDTEEECIIEMECTTWDSLIQENLINILSQNPPDIDSLLEQGDTITLYEIMLCDGSTIYLLEDELPLINGTGIPIIDTLDFAPDEVISVVTTPESRPYTGDLYNLYLKYEPNGNIEKKYWQVYGRNMLRYEYQYDGLNRIRLADFSEHEGEGNSWTTMNRYGVFDIDYDADGNLLTLKRNGPIAKCENGGLSFGLIDDLDYEYGTTQSSQRSPSIQPNQVLEITDNGTEKGFDPGNGGGGYTYDANGNLTVDSYKGLTIEYNHLNLPKEVTGPGGVLKIIYDASGRKLRMAGVGPTLDYMNGVEYEGGFFGAMYHDEGRVVLQNEGTYQFFIRDHLGNTQLIFADNNENGLVEPWLYEILQEDHYYPFGMHFEGQWYWAPYQFPGDGDEDECLENGRIPYQHNSKEFIFKQKLKWYDHGFRWYDPAIARWAQADPLADWAPDWTPYRYGYNNPLIFSDPLGLFESRKAAKEYRKSSDDEDIQNGKIKKNKDGTFSVRFGESGSVTRRGGADGEYDYSSVASKKEKSNEPPRFHRGPDPGWESDMYDAIWHEDDTYTWIYRGSGEPYIPPANLAEAIGRSFPAFGSLTGGSKATKLVADAMSRIKPDRIGHIMQNHHAWQKLMANPTWGKIKPLIKKTLREGAVVPYKDVSSKILMHKGFKIQVTYIKINGKIHVSDAWIMTK